jgi:very-short-patch-repair endonuclease
VRARQEVPAALRRVAIQQAGVVSRVQALEGGLTPTVIRRLLTDGSWGQLDRGLYLVPDRPAGWNSRVWGAVLLGGAHARVTGRSAAVLYGLDEGEPLPIEVLIPFGRRLSNRDWVHFRQEREHVRAGSARPEPARVRVEDAVLDLCAIGSQSAVVDWVTRAVQRRLTTPEALAAAMSRRARMPGRMFVQQVIGDVASGAHSGLERTYLHDVERAHGLAGGRRQRARPGGAGFLDVLYEEYALVVELDGRVGHVGEGRWRDRRRDNVHTRTGLRTLRFGWHEVTHEPCEVALEVAEVLIGLGWPGYPARCPRCR